MINTDDMIVVELYTYAEYISDCEEVSLPQLNALGVRLLGKAEAQGLVECFLKFESTMEPYEDYLGSVKVVACGYREKNSLEVQRETLENLAYEISEKLNFNPPVYEVLNLVKRGKTEKEILEFLDYKGSE